MGKTGCKKMSKVEKAKQHSHRPSHGKQINKPIKGGSNSSAAKGKLAPDSKKPSSNGNGPSLSKKDRRNQSKVKLLFKKEQLNQAKDLFSSESGPARRIFCVPLTKNADP